MRRKPLAQQVVVVTGASTGLGRASSLVLPSAINIPQFDRDRQKIGFQPRPVPPIYEPGPFAEAVLHCCERPIRELPIGWGAQKLLWGQKLVPRAADRQLRRMGWKSQHTDEPKPIGLPDNLFETLPGDPGARGRFSAQARRGTAWTSIRLRKKLGYTGWRWHCWTSGTCTSRSRTAPRSSRASISRSSSGRCTR